PLSVSAAGAVLEYLETTQRSSMPKFLGISTYFVDGHLVMDPYTRKNLEISETARDKSFEGSLLWVLDKSRTAMGSRTLRKWLNEPLYSVPAIKERHEAVQELIDKPEVRKSLDQSFSGLSDLERLAVKLTSSSVGPRDLIAITQSLEKLFPLIDV